MPAADVDECATRLAEIGEGVLPLVAKVRTDTTPPDGAAAVLAGYARELDRVAARVDRLPDVPGRDGARVRVRELRKVLSSVGC